MKQFEPTNEIEDYIAKCNKDIEQLRKYLPVEYTESEVVDMIDQSDIQSAMKDLKAKLDPTRISQSRLYAIVSTHFKSKTGM